jgi:hypothetical protein
MASRYFSGFSIILKSNYSYLAFGNLYRASTIVLGDRGRSGI